MRSAGHPLSIDVKIFDFGGVHPVDGQNLNFSDWAQILSVEHAGDAKNISRILQRILQPFFMTSESFDCDLTEKLYKKNILTFRQV